MGSRSPETQIKRARELALKERRERKQAKKDARAAERRRELEEPTVATEEGGEPASNPSRTNRPKPSVSRRNDFAQPVRVDVVDEAANAVAVEEERRALETKDRLPYVGVEVLERLDRELGATPVASWSSARKPSSVSFCIPQSV